MAKQIILFNQHIAVEKSQEIDPNQSDENGPVVIPIWTLIFTDKAYMDQVRVSFPEAARDDIVKGLMGGVILPGMGGAIT